MYIFSTLLSVRSDNFVRSWPCNTVHLDWFLGCSLPPLTFICRMDTSSIAGRMSSIEREFALLLTLLNLLDTNAFRNSQNSNRAPRHHGPYALCLSVISSRSGGFRSSSKANAIFPIETSTACGAVLVRGFWAEFSTEIENGQGIHEFFRESSQWMYSFHSDLRIFSQCVILLS